MAFTLAWLSSLLAFTSPSLPPATCQSESLGFAAGFLFGVAWVLVVLVIFIVFEVVLGCNCCITFTCSLKLWETLRAFWALILGFVFFGCFLGVAAMERWLPGSAVASLTPSCFASPMPEPVPPTGPSPFWAASYAANAAAFISFFRALVIYL